VGGKQDLNNQDDVERTIAMMILFVPSKVGWSILLLFDLPEFLLVSCLVNYCCNLTAHLFQECSPFGYEIALFETLLFRSFDYYRLLSFSHLALIAKHSKSTQNYPPPLPPACK
jgi:hypothetical protein